MAIFIRLKTLISQSIRNCSNSASSRPFFSLCGQQSVVGPSSPISGPFLLSRNGCIRRHFLLRCGIFFPVMGPLFLSNSPWKLSQSATPLLLQSDAVVNFLKLRALNLLQSPGLKYTLSPRLLDKDGTVEFRNAIDADHRLLRESYLNLPNYISLARLLSGPVIAWMLMNEMYPSAFFALGISGASDWLDGYVARKMNINSIVGSYLDPLADKVLIGCVAIAMVEKDLLHPGLVALVLIRDAALLGGALYKRGSILNWQLNNWRVFFDLTGSHAEKMEPLFISKVNTFFQLVLVAAALLQPAFGNVETQLYINVLSLLVAFTTLTSTAAYGRQFLNSRGGQISSRT